jgi:hypothetical protein
MRTVPRASSQQVIAGDMCEDALSWGHGMQACKAMRQGYACGGRHSARRELFRFMTCFAACKTRQVHAWSGQ